MAAVWGHEIAHVIARHAVRRHSVGKLHFTLTFPEDWQIKREPEPDYIIARHPENKALLNVWLQDLNRQIPPRDFLSTRLGLKNLHNGASFDY